MKTVVSFTLPSIDDIKCTNVRNFQIPGFEVLRRRANNARALLDKPYKTDKKRYTSIVAMFEYEYIFRPLVHERYNASNVSNAWLKAWEMYKEYKVIPAVADTFVYMDNAAFPGSWILAAWHMVKTECEIKDFKWYGSSLSTPSADNKGPLEDSYGLWKNYPNNWLMSADNNGDVTIYENQKKFYNRLGGTVNLYTSDLGFDVSSDYNKEEEIHSHANLGQIITGLMVLKGKSANYSGGAMITKQYTFMTPFLVSIMGALTRVFDRVDICKPMFSRSGNSESYLVCIGYHGFDPTDMKSVQSIFLKRLINFSLKPLITKSCLGNDFIRVIQQAQTHFVEAQILKLSTLISEYERFSREKKIDKNYIKNNNVFAKENKKDQDNWLIRNEIKRIDNSKQLNVVEVINRYQRH